MQVGLWWRKELRESYFVLPSVASVLGGLAPIPYTVSKHAILGLVRAASIDLGKYGIRVNCISPSGVVTPLLMDYFHEGFGDPSYTPQQAQNFVDTHANLSGHSIAPKDVASAALYLASDDAAFVSGLNFILDGGFSLIQSLKFSLNFLLSWMPVVKKIPMLSKGK
ncbi:hypothetical protein L7F22_046480 [Adiantum nelumboides]|nr:hypothetical protein [Adiantum nelumboides]